MSHWRTSREIDGGNQSPGSPLARYMTPRDYINKWFPSGSILTEPREAPFECSEFSEPLLDERELGSCLLFCAVFILPAFIVALLVLGYLTFVA